jgi:hypothetical protein
LLEVIVLLQLTPKSARKRWPAGLRTCSGVSPVASTNSHVPISLPLPKLLDGAMPGTEEPQPGVALVNEQTFAEQSAPLVPVRPA